MVVLLILHADCSLLALKPARSSRLLPGVEGKQLPYSSLPFLRPIKILIFLASVFPAERTANRIFCTSHIKLLSGNFSASCCFNARFTLIIEQILRELESKR